MALFRVLCFYFYIMLKIFLLRFLQVLAFFSARLEQHPEQTLSVQVVLDVIKQGALQWPRDRLKVSKLREEEMFVCRILTH